MHSRIFQISANPIEREDYIDSLYYDYEHWFTYRIADYVRDSDRDADIEWLSNCKNGFTIGKDAHGDYIIINSKEEYFAAQFESFKRELEKITRVTLDDFISGIDLYSLNDANEEKFGFYVEYCHYKGIYDNETITFDQFVRNCSIGVKYYIGGTVDYHF